MPGQAVAATGKPDREHAGSFRPDNPVATVLDDRRALGSNLKPFRGPQKDVRMRLGAGLVGGSAG